MDSIEVDRILTDVENISTKSPNLIKKMFTKKISTSQESSVEGEKETKLLKSRKKSKKPKTRAVDLEIAKLRTQLEDLALCQNQIQSNECFSSSEVSSSDDEKIFPLRASMTELDLDKHHRDYSTERISKGKDKGDFFQAVKAARELTIGQPTTSNIASWLSKFWKNLEKAFPSLTTEEKIRVVLSRLPNQYSTFLISSECGSKKELFSMVGVLFAYGTLDRSNAMQRFFSVSPRRGSTLLNFISELLDLSISLDLPRNNRHVLVLRRLLTFLPFYFRNIVGDKLEQV